VTAWAGAVKHGMPSKNHFWELRLLNARENCPYAISTSVKYRRRSLALLYLSGTLNTYPDPCETPTWH